MRSPTGLLCRGLGLAQFLLLGHALTAAARCSGSKGSVRRSTRYGSLEATFAKWNNQKVKRDNPAEGRVSFRPLWNMFNEKSARDQDTAEFLHELQTRFYTETTRYLRSLGFKGVITPSNWITASPEVLTPLEKLCYTTGDFIDRHGYFGCNHKGPNAEWSVRNGHTYSDRSALRFDPEVPGQPRQFSHPVMDPHYNGLPSMISETTFCRPNRYRSEAPLYYAAFGALQHSDASEIRLRPKTLYYYVAKP